MTKLLGSIFKAILTGLLILIPVYLAVLLLLKGLKSVVGLVKPIAALLPESVRSETLLSLVIVMGICFLIGAYLRTETGRIARETMEKKFFERIPGYALLRSLTQQMAGNTVENVWKPALIDTDDGAMVLGFVIEEFE